MAGRNVQANPPEKPPEPPLPADSQVQSSSRRRFDASASIRRLPRSAYADPVDDWKRQALINAGADQAGSQPGSGLTLQVRAGFVLLVMTAGAPLGVLGWASTLLTFLSVLFVQELPSVLWAIGGGRSAKIVLSAGGSRTQLGGAALGMFRAFALALCGSLGNLGIAFALGELVRRGLAGSAAPLISSAAVVHAVWGAGQAFPLAPFRAGRALALRLRPALRFAFAALSFVSVLVAALWALRAPGFPVYFSSFILVIVAATAALGQAFNELREQQAGVPLLAAAAAARLGADEPEQAMELARRALANTHVEGNRAGLYKTLAWAAIGKRDPFVAHSALDRVAPAARDLHLVAAYLACCNRVDEAIELLQQARRDHPPAPETSKLLVDLLFQSGQEREALVVAESDRALYAARDWHAIEACLGRPLRAG